MGVKGVYAAVVHDEDAVGVFQRYALSVMISSGMLSAKAARILASVAVSHRGNRQV